MSDSKLVWYHVATHEWRDAPPKDGTWAMEHIQGLSPFSRLPSHLDIIDRLEVQREKIHRDLTTLRSLAAAMADEMEQHGGAQAFDSLARYRAEMEKEDKR